MPTRLSPSTAWVIQIKAGTKAVGALGATTALGLGAATASFEGFTIPTGLIEVGPWGLLIGVVAFIFYGVFRGWIIPKPHYDTLMARAIAAEDVNSKMAERLMKLTETNSVQARTIDTQAAVGDTVTKLVDAIQSSRAPSGGSA
jgi:hypothetical protein